LDAFVDESGELGFSEKSTKFFIVAHVVPNPMNALEISMKRVLKRIHQKKGYHFSRNELKFSRMNAECRRTVIENISLCQADIGVVVVEKSKVKAELRNDLTILYNWLLVHHIMSALVPRLGSGEKIRIVFDKSLPKSRVASFNEYLRNKASYLAYVEGYTIDLNHISLNHANSEFEPCLQAADAIAGAYFQKYEHSDAQYAEIIKDKVHSFRYLW
jgi:hypothetical protein